MRIVHLVAHLGGGVGKAHSALCGADGGDVRRHYVLLEQPRDRRYVDAVIAAGAEVTVAPTPAEARALIAEADILQVEWWNHPKLYEALVRWALPASCTVFWSHVSGLHAPFIPPALVSAPERFLFTSSCSVARPAVSGLSEETRRRIDVVNSGFGFGSSGRPSLRRAGRVGYLGTVDFSKLSRDFFAVVERAGAAEPVSLWGAVDADSEVLAHRSQAVRFEGHAADPEAALRQTGIFLYLLQPEHFGTAENALVEAMSLGCVPLVFDNPAERAIVEHGRTGFVETSVDAAAERLRWMLANPGEVMTMGVAAAEAMAATRNPRQSAQQLAAIYREVIDLPKRQIDYAALLGATPALWYLSTQGGWAMDASPLGPARKGTLAHFAQSFPGDASFAALRTKAAVA
ncbi:glycosyltransferase [Aurantiacibacter suaedae]|uniref:glycosyltransferase n=1 Tax=Aurantiacibacter suaedae TaxID=2545755 RepID=UPI0010F4FAB4|nr:glycosyltransferase [Aurantiacibacter suaedae]